MSRERAARHEAAHCVAAHALGWMPKWAAIPGTGFAYTCVRPPERLDRPTRAKQFVVICYAAREYVGRTANHSDRGDVRDAYRELMDLTNDRWRVAALESELRGEARRLVDMPEFCNATRRVARELDAFGKLDAHDLNALLCRDRFRFEPRPELPRELPR